MTALKTARWITEQSGPRWAGQGCSTLLADAICQWLGDRAGQRGATLLVLTGNHRTAQYIAHLVGERAKELGITYREDDARLVKFVTSRDAIVGYRGPLLVDTSALELFAREVLEDERGHAAETLALTRAIEHNILTYVEHLAEIRAANTTWSRAHDEALAREDVLADAYLDALDQITRLEYAVCNLAKLVAT